MTSDDPTFNLLDEPWIRVRTVEGRLEQLSLLEVLATAHQLRALAGEIPTQDAAILRLLEAALLGVVRGTAKVDREDRAVALWRAWWDRGRLPMEVLSRYFETHRDRFDLLHPHTPFMQVAGLTTSSGKRSGLGKLIAEIPDGHQYFTTRAGADVSSLSLAEAARWLVHCQAFDPAGIKTGAVGDDRVKGGKGYSMGYPAWAGNLGLLIAEGQTLFETLMLNLPVGLQADGLDEPVWERKPQTAAMDATHPAPTGPADLFTWPSRRILLFVHSRRVTDVQISNGDRLGPQNQFSREPMSAWQHSANQTKTAGHDVMMPVMHRPERRLWQGLSAVLATDPATRTRRPHTLEWLHTLVQHEALPSSRIMRYRAVGLEYGTQNSVIVGSIDDALTAHVAALTDPVLMAAAVDAAGRASIAVAALAKLSSNLALAAGGDPEAPRAAAYELGYSLLDAPYRSWLVELVDPARVEEALESWGEQAGEILRAAGARMREDAGPIARVGRQVPKRGTDATQHLDAALAEIWFRGALTKALVPHPTPPEAKS